MLHKQWSRRRLKSHSSGSSAETSYSLTVCGVHVNDFNYSSEFRFDLRKRPGSMSNTIPFSQMDKLNPFLRLSMFNDITRLSSIALQPERHGQLKTLFKVLSYILSFFRSFYFRSCTSTKASLNFGLMRNPSINPGSRCSLISRVNETWQTWACESVRWWWIVFQSLIPYASVKARTEACNSTRSVSVTPPLMTHGQEKQGRIMPEWQEPWGQQA